MKKQACLLAVFCFSLVAALAQQGIEQKKDTGVKALLCQSWTLTQFIVNSTVKPVPEGAETYTYRPNGTYSVSRSQGGEQKTTEGTWRYEPQTNTLYRGEGSNERAIGKIFKLTEEELIIEDEPKVKMKMYGEEVKTAKLVYKKT